MVVRFALWWLMVVVQGCIINRMQSFEGESSESIEFLKVLFDLKTDKQGDLALKMYGPSEYFFKCFRLLAIPGIKGALSGYHPVPQVGARAKLIVFSRLDGRDGCGHGELRSCLLNFISKFRVCVVQYVSERRDVIGEVVRRLGVVSEELRTTVVEGGDRESIWQLIIYFSRDEVDLEGRIRRCVQVCGRFMRERLVYSLNTFISGEIRRQFHLHFVEQIVKEYGAEIRDLLSRNRDKYESLGILYMQGVFVGRQGGQRWLRQEREGMYGVQMEVEGLDCEIIKFYSELQLFFGRLRYCVKDVESGVDYQSFMGRRHESKKVRFIFLSNKQYVILGLPEYFEEAAVKIEKHLWTIDYQMFPNCEFALFKRREKCLRRFLRGRLNVCQNLVVGEKAISFESDSRNYERIMQSCRQFLRNNIEHKMELNFIKDEFQLNLVNEFILPALCFQNFQVKLQWQKGIVICYCPISETARIYNKIHENYVECMGQLKEINSQKYVSHGFVRVQENPTDLNAQHQIQRKLSIPELNFSIVLKDYCSVNKADYAIMLVVQMEKSVELGKILQENSKQLPSGSDPVMQIETEGSKQLKSVILWNYRMRERGDSWERGTVFERLLILVREKRQMVLFLTKEIYMFDFQFFLNLLRELPHEGSESGRKVTIILSDQFQTVKKREIEEEILRLFREGNNQKIQISYILSQQALVNVIKLGYYQLQWNLSINGLCQTIACSSLNSFVFYAERYNINTYASNRQNFGIFLPKRGDSLTQLLVQLSTGKVQQYKQQSFFPFKNQNMLLLIGRIVKLFIKNFPQQTYAVLYKRKQSNDLITSVYVYRTKREGQLKKYVIVRDENGVDVLRKTDVEPIEYSMKKLKGGKYRLITHPRFYENVKKLVK